MRTIELEGTYNARAAGPSTSPWLVRSAAPDLLSDRGRAVLTELDVRLVVDLRETVERTSEARGPGVPVRSVPLYGTPAGPPAIGSLEAVYTALLTTRGRALAEAVGAIADALDESAGAVLVHCTAGKDRTGLVVALVLLSVGSTADEVVADYEASGASVALHRSGIVSAALDELALDDAARAEALRLHLESPATVMRDAIQAIGELGGAHAYLLEHGVTAEQLERLGVRARSAAVVGSVSPV